MAPQMKTPNRGRLWSLVLVAAILGAASGYAFWHQIERGGGMGWVGWLIIIMLAIITYSISFYFAHRFFENSLDQYIVSDTFRKKHDWIDLETESRDSGDSGIDSWVAHYKFIRTMFAMGILPLLACLYLFFFA